MVRGLGQVRVGCRSGLCGRSYDLEPSAVIWWYGCDQVTDRTVQQGRAPGRCRRCPSSPIRGRGSTSACGPGRRIGVEALWRQGVVRAKARRAARRQDGRCRRVELEGPLTKSTNGVPLASKALPAMPRVPAPEMAQIGGAGAVAPSDVMLAGDELTVMLSRSPHYLALFCSHSFPASPKFCISPYFYDYFLFIPPSPLSFLLDFLSFLFSLSLLFGAVEAEVAFAIWYKLRPADRRAGCLRRVLQQFASCTASSHFSIAFLCRPMPFIFIASSLSSSPLRNRRRHLHVGLLHDGGRLRGKFARGFSRRQQKVRKERKKSGMAGSFSA